MADGGRIASLLGSSNAQADPQGVQMAEYFDSPVPRFRPDGSKAHHTDRIMGQPLVERWTNAKAGYIGYLTGRGYSSSKIAKIVGDSTAPATVRGMWRRWGLPRPASRLHKIVPVEIAGAYHGKLSERAQAVGITPNEFLRRVIICVVVDDLYAAVVDDKFDKKLADQP